MYDNLRAKFGEDDVQITSEEAPKGTGIFDVEIGGKMVHSKSRGDGTCDNPDCVQKLIKLIQQSLAS